MDLGAPELVIILVLALLLFGSSQLPKLARSIGEAQREFKKGHKEHDDQSTPPTPPAVPPPSSPL